MLDFLVPSPFSLPDGEDLGLFSIDTPTDLIILSLVDVLSSLSTGVALYISQDVARLLLSKRFFFLCSFSFLSLFLFPGSVLFASFFFNLSPFPILFSKCFAVFDLLKSCRPVGEAVIMDKSLLSSSSLLKSYASALDFLRLIPSKSEFLIPGSFILIFPLGFLIFIFSLCNKLFSFGELISRDRRSLCPSLSSGLNSIVKSPPMSWREIEELLTGLRLLKGSDRSNERVE